MNDFNISNSYKNTLGDKLKHNIHKRMNIIAEGSDKETLKGKIDLLKGDFQAGPLPNESKEDFIHRLVAGGTEGNNLNVISEDIYNAKHDTGEVPKSALSQVNNLLARRNIEDDDKKGLHVIANDAGLIEVDGIAYNIADLANPTNAAALPANTAGVYIKDALSNGTVNYYQVNSSGKLEQIAQYPDNVNGLNMQKLDKLFGYDGDNDGSSITTIS